MKARLAAAVAVLLLTPGTASGTGSLMPTMEIRSATATVCLTDAVQEELAEDGIRLEAIEPAVQADTGDRTCVALPIVGKVALDLHELDVHVQGGLRFVREDGTRLDFHSIRARTEGATIVGHASVNDRDDRIEMFTLRVSDTRVQPTANPVGMRVAGGITASEDVAREFEQGFGDAVVEPGDALFDGTAAVEVVSPTEVLGGLLPF